jgi:hypothetical protein
MLGVKTLQLIRKNMILAATTHLMQLFLANVSLPVVRWIHTLYAIPKYEGQN